MEIKIGDYVLENDVDCKCIPDGWEIFPEAVHRFNITPADFTSAEWAFGKSIIVELE